MYLHYDTYTLHYLITGCAKNILPLSFERNRYTELQVLLHSLSNVVIDIPFFI